MVFLEEETSEQIPVLCITHGDLIHQCMVRATEKESYLLSYIRDKILLGNNLDTEWQLELLS